MNEEDSRVFLDACNCGKMFAHSFRVLMEKHISARTAMNLQDFKLIVPALVNGAFSAELFIKYLIDEKMISHNLSSLMERLKKTSVQKYENIIHDTIYTMNQKMITYNEQEFQKDLEACSNMFEKIRYIYEPTKNDVVYNLDFLESFIAALESQCNE